MSLLITFIVLWALTPGPVTIMTIHKAKTEGARAGVSVATGATITAVFMVLIALLVHMLGFRVAGDTQGFVWVEQLGGMIILLMGLYAAYKAIRLPSESAKVAQSAAGKGMGVMQGIMLMATNTPQAVIFYTVIVPQAIDAELFTSMVMALGSLKVVLMFVWHAFVALMVNKAQALLSNRRVGKGLDFATACVMVGLGVNILV